MNVDFPKLKDAAHYGEFESVLGNIQQCGPGASGLSDLYPKNRKLHTACAECWIEGHISIKASSRALVDTFFVNAFIKLDIAIEGDPEVDTKCSR